MNPENILKQIRDNRDAEYSLMVALAGCLSQLIQTAEIALEYPRAPAAATGLLCAVEEARRLLSGDARPSEKVEGTIMLSDCQRPQYKPVMRSG